MFAMWQWNCLPSIGCLRHHGALEELLMGDTKSLSTLSGTPCLPSRQCLLALIFAMWSLAHSAMNWFVHHLLFLCDHGQPLLRWKEKQKPLCEMCQMNCCFWKWMDNRNWLSIFLWWHWLPVQWAPHSAWLFWSFSVPLDKQEHSSPFPFLPFVKTTGMFHFIFQVFVWLDTVKFTHASKTISKVIIIICTKVFWCCVYDTKKFWRYLERFSVQNDQKPNWKTTHCVFLVRCLHQPMQHMHQNEFVSPQVYHMQLVSLSMPYAWHASFVQKSSHFVMTLVSIQEMSPTWFCTRHSIINWKNKWTTIANQTEGKAPQQSKSQFSLLDMTPKY